MNRSSPLAARLGRWFGAGPVEATADDDWRLWQRAIDGDETSARRLVALLTPTALGLARQMLSGSQAAAEDAVQDAFLRLWRSRPRDTGAARLSTYFHTIVINRCRTRWVADQREQATDPALLAEQIDAAGPDGRVWPGDGSATAEPIVGGVLGALDTLPPRQRMALAMWALADATPAEIAQSLRIDPNAAHQLLHRAKATLRRRWQPTDEDTHESR